MYPDRHEHTSGENERTVHLVPGSDHDFKGRRGFGADFESYRIKSHESGYELSQHKEDEKNPAAPERGNLFIKPDTACPTGECDEEDNHGSGDVGEHPRGAEVTKERTQNKLEDEQGE